MYLPDLLAYRRQYAILHFASPRPMTLPWKEPLASTAAASLVSSPQLPRKGQVPRRQRSYHSFYTALVGSGIDRLGGADGLIFSREARWSKQNRLPLKSTSKVSVSGSGEISRLISIPDAPNASVALANGVQDCKEICICVWMCVRICIRLYPFGAKDIFLLRSNCRLV